jgi:hypothetical protein
MADGPAERGNAAVRWAAVSFLAYAVLHHLGTWSAGLGEVGNSGTRWEDWAQLAVPFAVRGSAARLHALASDARWRVREDVAMALRRLGGADPPRLFALAAAWAKDEDPLVQREAVAGVCEPRLLRDRPRIPQEGTADPGPAGRRRAVNLGRERLLDSDLTPFRLRGGGCRGQDGVALDLDGRVGPGC